MKKYISYGSNSSVKWMKKLCPNCIYLGSGWLDGAILRFRGNGYLNLILDQGYSRVPLTIWKIDEEGEKSLDEYEEYPDLYYKEEIFIDTPQGKETGMVYLMNPPYRDKPQLPSPEYVNIVREGYEDQGFSLDALNDALEEIEYI